MIPLGRDSDSQRNEKVVVEIVSGSSPPAPGLASLA